MSGTCEYSKICGRDALDGHDGKCILHSEDLCKDIEAFEEALSKHQEEHGADFCWMVFPSITNFQDATFEKANFRHAAFEYAHFWDTSFEEVNFAHAAFEYADFSQAAFKKAYFSDATFEEANFSNATFKKAYFWDATFEEASFWEATFKEADFSNAAFEYADFPDATFEEADFSDAAFKEADFSDATFNGGASFNRAFEAGKVIRFNEADFSGCEFGGDVLFAGESEMNRAFAGGEVSFENITLAPDASLRFRYADLSRGRFLRTNLRDVEFTGVKWCREFSEWFGRAGLYDEVVEIEGQRWSEVERLYRQLKRNHEERGDFSRGGDFHIGEKEARRKSSGTSTALKFLLYIYRALSKYGERALPGLFWLILLVFGCAVGYLSMEASSDSVTLSSICSPADWWKGLVLSSEATLFPLRPAGFQDIGPRTLNLVQRVLSPILLALLALALRQRMKR